MRSTYGKIAYAYLTYVIGKNNAHIVRTVAPWGLWVMLPKLMTV